MLLFNYKLIFSRKKVTASMESAKIKITNVKPCMDQTLKRAILIVMSLTRLDQLMVFVVEVFSSTGLSLWNSLAVPKGDKLCYQI